MKELVHKRLRVAEEKLLELDSSHGELVARQKALKDEICGEALGRSGGPENLVGPPACEPQQCYLSFWTVMLVLRPTRVELLECRCSSVQLLMTAKVLGTHTKHSSSCWQR